MPERVELLEDAAGGRAWRLAQQAGLVTRLRDCRSEARCLRCLGALPGVGYCVVGVAGTNKWIVGIMVRYWRTSRQSKCWRIAAVIVFKRRVHFQRAGGVANLRRSGDHCTVSSPACPVFRGRSASGADAIARRAASLQP